MKCLNSLHGGGSCSSGLCSIQQNRLHNGIKDPDLGVCGQIWGSPYIFRMESYPCCTNLYFYVRRHLSHPVCQRGCRGKWGSPPSSSSSPSSFILLWQVKMVCIIQLWCVKPLPVCNGFTCPWSEPLFSHNPDERKRRDRISFHYTGPLHTHTHTQIILTDSPSLLLFPSLSQTHTYSINAF